jgi:hypothetical protein
LWVANQLVAITVNASGWRGFMDRCTEPMTQHPVGWLVDGGLGLR